MKTSPIALFVYNRPEHTRKTIEALQKNFLAKESELFIFSDGPKNEEPKNKIDQIRKYLKTISGFKSVTIFEKEENSGLANSIISGVTEIVEKYGKVIVMEDDLVSSPYFLKFMNEALNFYENDERVASVHGYLYPVKNKTPDTFFVKHVNSWGWATWKRAWNLFEKDGKRLLDELVEKNLLGEFDFNGSYNFSGMIKRQIIGTTDSWAIRWNASSLVNDKLNLYPGVSLIQNIGQDGSGSHKGNSDSYKIAISNSIIKVEKISVEVNTDSIKAFEKYFRSLKPSITRRIVNKISNLKK